MLPQDYNSSCNIIQKGVNDINIKVLTPNDNETRSYDLHKTRKPIQKPKYSKMRNILSTNLKKVQKIHKKQLILNSQRKQKFEDVNKTNVHNQKVVLSPLEKLIEKNYQSQQEPKYQSENSYILNDIIKKLEEFKNKL